MIVADETKQTASTTTFLRNQEVLETRYKISGIIIYFTNKIQDKDKTCGLCLIYCFWNLPNQPWYNYTQQSHHLESTMDR